MEKNVIVVDENGNEYGATYPKRARGLVKSGRARFIDENRICLACPPSINGITEDIEMSDNKKIEAAEVAETTEIAEATENTATKYTIDYVLEQIAKLQADTEYIKAAVLALSHNVQDPSGSRAEALNSAVACREETNWKLIAFYEKMYDDLKPTSKANKLEKINMLLAHLSECQNDSAACYMGDELRRLMED